MVENFSATIDAWAKKSQKRMLAVRNQSTQDIIDDAQLPTAKGGRMHVDTGFLRASGQSSLTGMPTGPIRGAKDQTYGTDPGGASVNIGKWPLGGSFFFGWTANYARPREAKDAFLRLAVMKWPNFVTNNIAKAKARFK
jgi:hypothetical protein